VSGVIDPQDKAGNGDAKWVRFSFPVQLTPDPDRRDWFPHVSPDRKQVAFVSCRLVL
jgi:hypothetical protein